MAAAGGVAAAIWQMLRPRVMANDLRKRGSNTAFIDKKRKMESGEMMLECRMEPAWGEI
jgi:hypothetical protein